MPTKGAIHPYQGRIAPKSPLICSNVAEGHTKAVLSVFATDELLFSASKVIYLRAMIDIRVWLDLWYKGLGIPWRVPQTTSLPTSDFAWQEISKSPNKKALCNNES